MSKTEISVGLEYITTPDLQTCIRESVNYKCKFIVAPIVHPRFRRHFIGGIGNIGGFTRSDLVLSPKEWTQKVVGKLSSYLNVDSPSSIVRQRHEDCMNEELFYSKGLGLSAVMLTLHGLETYNLARILQTYFETSHFASIIWTSVPMVCNKTLRQSPATTDDGDDEDAWNETWHWWSKFHERLEFDKRVGLVLEITADLPSQEILNRWLGEPVKAIILPTSIFQTNKKGYPVLSRAHQFVVISMLEKEVQVIISGARRASISHYMQYLYMLWKHKPNPFDDCMLSYARGWEDYLQTPLQPLADNLDTQTYNVFEKDPVKYDRYQKAIAQAMIDIQSNSVALTNNNSLAEQIQNSNEIVEKPLTIMVLGAGRGPLIRATLNAADITKTKVKVIAVEKNPCAVVVLTALVRELWSHRDVCVAPGDMRQLNIAPKADIIVSELLGSWGDNELSPECLDGATGLLKKEGISIPCQYSSYVAPISSSRLWAAAKTASAVPSYQHYKDKNLETLWVVYMQSKHDIAETKSLFTFEHPAKGIRNHEGKLMTDNKGLPLTDNRKSKSITWEVTQDNVLHGFGGYFDCTLYGSHTLSIVPTTHTPEMISWFPVFIPIKTPLRVKKGEVIKATFWRCVNARRVWYEWMVEVGNQTTALHNPNGRSSEMLL